MLAGGGSPGNPNSTLYMPLQFPLQWSSSPHSFIQSTPLLGTMAGGVLQTTKFFSKTLIIVSKHIRLFCLPEAADSFCIQCVEYNTKCRKYFNDLRLVHVCLFAVSSRLGPFHILPTRRGNHRAHPDQPTRWQVDDQFTHYHPLWNSFTTKRNS